MHDSAGLSCRSMVCVLDLQTGFHNMEHPVCQSLAKAVDPELSEVILGLLHPDTKQRMSASAALSCPVFKEHVAVPVVYNLTAVSSDHDTTAANVSRRQHCIRSAGTSDVSKHSQADAAVNKSSAVDNAAPSLEASAKGEDRPRPQPCSIMPQSDCDNLAASPAAATRSSSSQVKLTFDPCPDLLSVKFRRHLMYFLHHALAVLILYAQLSLHKSFCRLHMTWTLSSSHAVWLSAVVHFGKPS